IALYLGLAGENVPFRLVLRTKRILHRHAYAPGKEFHPARSARSRTTGVIDEHAEFIGSVKNRTVCWNGRCGVRSLETHLPGDIRGARAFGRGIAGDGPE